MKRQFLLSLVLVGMFAIPALAQTDPFMPLNPTTMGMGGAYTANAEGYNAFFYNPAGFARKSEFTLLSVNVYGMLDKNIYQMLSAIAAGKQPVDALTGIKSASGKALDLSQFGLDPSVITDLTTVATDVGDYLATVPPANITAALANMNSDPTTAAALAAAGIDLNDPSFADDPTAVMGALLPILLSDPSQVNALISAFLSDVESQPGSPATTLDTTAGATLQVALGKVIDGLEKMFPSGNANIGAMMGVGYVGNGFGIGLFTNVSGGLYTPTGQSILSGLARANTSITLAAGMAFDLFEGFSLGFEVRPTLSGYVSFLPASLLTKMVTGDTPTTAQIMTTILSNGVYKGFRIGFDVGALWDIGDFTLGMAIKDIIPYPTAYKVYNDSSSLTVGQFISELSDFKGAKTDIGYQVPPIKINVGAQWHPDLGTLNDVFDPRVGVDMMDIAGWIRNSPADKAAMLNDYDFLRMINIGAQIKLFKFLTFSAGLGQGMATAGFGMNLVVVDINAAVGARYKNNPKAIDDFSEVGFSMEVAILRL